MLKVEKKVSQSVPTFICQTRNAEMIQQNWLVATVSHTYDFKGKQVQTLE